MPKKLNYYYCSSCFPKIPKENLLIEPIQEKRKCKTRCASCNQTFPIHTIMVVIKRSGIKLGYLRKCNKCGFEAKTKKDLTLFKTHSTFDPYYSSYAYGKDPICLRCFRAKDNKQHQNRRDKNPKIYRDAVMACYYNDPERLKKSRARDYSFRYLTAANSCALCGVSDVPLEKHHPDYDRPDFVVTLCRSCHHRLHINRRVPSQNKPALCNECENHPAQSGTFYCGYHKCFLTEKQKRHVFCRGFCPIKSNHSNPTKRV